MTDAEKIAAFLASKGARKIATGASSGISDRQFYLASRGEISLKPKTDNELIEERHTRGGVVYNGLGEVIATGDFDEAKWSHRHGGGLDY